MAGSETIHERMEVVGSEGAFVGTVERVERDRIKLAKSDFGSGGLHRYLRLDMVDCVEEGKVRLKISSIQAREAWRGTSRPDFTAPSGDDDAH